MNSPVWNGNPEQIVSDWVLLSVELTIDFHPVTCIWGHECCLEGLQEYQIFLLQTLLKISVDSHQRNSNSRMIQCNRTKFDGLRCIEVYLCAMFFIFLYDKIEGTLCMFTA